jgi:hypothetical protein
VGTRAYTHTLSLTHTFTARACGLKHPARVWVGAWECVADAAHPLAACAGARACVCGGERERGQPLSRPWPNNVAAAAFRLLTVSAVSRLALWHLTK